MTIKHQIKKKVQSLKERQFVIDILVVHYLSISFFNKEEEKSFIKKESLQSFNSSHLAKITDDILSRNAIIRNINNKCPITNRLLILKKQIYRNDPSQYINGSLITSEHVASILSWLEKNPDFYFFNTNTVIIDHLIKPKNGINPIFKKDLTIFDALCETGSINLIEYLLLKNKINVSNILVSLDKKLILTIQMQSFLEMHTMNIINPNWKTEKPTKL